MALSGWKLIGIIVSVAWIFTGVAIYRAQIEMSSRRIVAAHVACDSHVTGDAGFKECNKIADDSLASALTNERKFAALVAFVPMSLGWGFCYLVLFLVRWVKRGIGRPA
jgi:hypothetical protein